ncbi:hypothetical protein LZ30DRAFT_741625 [Colletotrichum cereale]|nr:hypothetical protein LZ30DRAFT_741625 [Colletotrichum cereale]
MLRDGSGRGRCKERTLATSRTPAIAIRRLIYVWAAPKQARLVAILPLSPSLSLYLVPVKLVFKAEMMSVNRNSIRPSCLPALLPTRPCRKSGTLLQFMPTHDVWDGHLPFSLPSGVACPSPAPPLDERPDTAEKGIPPEYVVVVQEVRIGRQDKIGIISHRRRVWVWI